MDDLDTSSPDNWTRADIDPLMSWDDELLVGSGWRPSCANFTMPRVLLVGQSHDLELSTIARKLVNRGAFVRVLLVDQIASQPSMELLQHEGEASFDIGFCRAYRGDRPVHYHFDKTLRRHAEWSAVPPTEQAFAAEQLNSLFWALMRRFEVSRWINSPWNVRDAENKLIQLDTAIRSGVKVPQTLATSRADDVRALAAKCSSGIIFKSLDSPIAHDPGETFKFFYTTPVDPTTLPDLKYPGLFQERIEPDEEFRITVVGRRMFAARIKRTPSNTVDWRELAPSDAAFEATVVPDSVRGSVEQIMSRLDIAVGGVDFLRVGDEFYFLEVNPSGAFLWLERTLEMEISECLTHLILSGR